MFGIGLCAGTGHSQSMCDDVYLCQETSVAVIAQESFSGSYWDIVHSPLEERMS